MWNTWRPDHEAPDGAFTPLFRHAPVWPGYPRLTGRAAGPARDHNNTWMARLNRAMTRVAAAAALAVAVALASAPAARAHMVLPDGAVDTLDQCMGTLNRMEFGMEAVATSLPRDELEEVMIWAFAKFRSLMAAFRNNVARPDLFDDENTGLIALFVAQDCVCVLAGECETFGDSDDDGPWWRP